MHLAERAREILEAAENATRQGQVCSEMTILIGSEGHIRMVADSDWPLDSLLRHHGVQSAYRVSGRSGAIRVEGLDGPRHCLLESVAPSRIARLLLG